jgi:hypothetical protein
MQSKDSSGDRPKVAEPEHPVLDPEFHELFDVSAWSARTAERDVAGEVVQREEEPAAPAKRRFSLKRTPYPDCFEPDHEGFDPEAPHELEPEEPPGEAAAPPHGGIGTPAGVPVRPQPAQADATKKLRRPINPRSSQQRHSHMPAAAGPRYATYDGTADYLRQVDRVIPALLHRGKVSVDQVSDGWHLLVVGTDTDGRDAYFLTSRRGLVPVVALEEPEMGSDRHGCVLVFTYSTVVPPYLSEPRLTHNDRRRVVAGMLREFMDPLPSEFVQSSRRRPF